MPPIMDNGGAPITIQSKRATSLQTQLTLELVQNSRLSPLNVAALTVSAAGALRHGPRIRECGVVYVDITPRTPVK